MTTRSIELLNTLKKTDTIHRYHNDDWPLIIYANKACTEDLETSTRWLADNKATLEELLLIEGAIYLRDFKVEDTQAFEHFIDSFPSQDIDYVGGVAPRGGAQGRTYESTKWPHDLKIPMHQEMAYMHRQPNRLCFYCLQAPQQDGETLVGNARTLALDTLDPIFVDKLRTKGLSYERNMRDQNVSLGDEDLDRVHTAWQVQYQTENRTEVEKILTDNGYDYRWEDDGSLTSLWRTPAFRKHRTSGEEVLFQSGHGTQTSSAMFGRLYEEKMKDFYAQGTHKKPFLTTFGDGEPMQEKDINDLLKLYELAEVKVPYQSGDVLMLDNQLALHGRNTFEGDRAIRVTFLA